MKLTKETKLKVIFQELFYALTGAVVIFFALETVWPRIVLAYINVSEVLILWMIIAIILLLIPEKK